MERLDLLFFPIRAMIFLLQKIITMGELVMIISCNDRVVNISETLEDFSSTGRKLPWNEMKEMSNYVAIAYDEINPAKAERLRACATELIYEANGTEKRLKTANFCRVRLCAMCQWRRALKNFSQVMKTVNALDGSCEFIFLTLTMRNVDEKGLSRALDGLVTGFKRLMAYKRVKGAVRGFYRGVEVTHNLNDNTFHPHIHALLAVSPNYFGRNYIKQVEWSDLWKKAMQVNYSIIVDVRRVKGNSAKAVAEVAKYSVKPNEIIVFDDWDLTVKTVRLLDEVLDNRRFISYGGIMAEMHKKLHLEDIESENVNLIQTDKKKIPLENAFELVYCWNMGYRQYRLKTE